MLRTPARPATGGNSCGDSSFQYDKGKDPEVTFMSEEKTATISIQIELGKKQRIKAILKEEQRSK